MLFPVIFILFVCLLIILLYIINVKAELVYKLNGLDDDISITFYTLWGLVKYEYKLPVKKKKEEETEKRSRIDSARDKLRNLTEFVRTIAKLKVLLQKKLVLKDYRLDVEFGAGDAFYSGVLSGVIWAAAGTITAYAVNTFRTCKKSVNVKTNFSEVRFKVELYCIFNIKIVHIIVVGLKLAIHNFRRKLRKRKRI